MSGGLTRVLLSTMKHAKKYSPEIAHEIVTFQDIDLETQSLFSQFKNQLFIKKSDEFIAAKIEHADVLQIEWWNHPLIYNFLHSSKLPAARVLICSHVSGLFRPQIITQNVVQFADVFLAVTWATENHNLFKNSSESTLTNKIKFIRFPIDIDRFEVHKSENNRFNIGYTGTVNYSKLHRDFLRMCSKARIDNARFIVCGHDENNSIEREAQLYDPNIFEFVGQVKDVSPILAKLDISDIR